MSSPPQNPLNPPDATGATPGLFDIPSGAPDEFAHVPTPRGRSAWVAAAAGLLAVFLAWRMRSDVAFSLSDSRPVELGSTNDLADRPPPLNRVISLAGFPDRASGALLDTQGRWDFSQFLRLRGTGNRAFVKRAADPLPLDRLAQDRFVGRAVPFDDLSFGESVRAFYRSAVAVPHSVSVESLKTALRTGAQKVLDGAGDPLAVTPDSVVVVESNWPGALRLEAPLERFPERRLFEEAITRTGGQLLADPTAADSKAPADRHIVLASFPEATAAAALSALTDVDRRIRYRPAHHRYHAVLQKLAVDGGTLVITTDGVPAVRLPFADLASVHVQGPLAIPDNAFVIVEGERPRDHLFKLVILAFLLAFSAVNFLALRRRP